MIRLCWAVFALLACPSNLNAGHASGAYQESGGKFMIGYAVADRDAQGAVRILLMGQAPPDSPDRDRHLDRLAALGEAAEGGYIELEPTSDGENFNITVRIDALGFGGGGQYPSRIDIGTEKAAGKIEGDVLNGQLNVTFEADFLPPRKVVADLPEDGGEPGKALLTQLQAVASGDRAAILGTLTAEQRAQFDALPPEEQDEAVAGASEFAPKNVRITGGHLYDGYAIVQYEAEVFGEPATGRALLSPDGDQWRVREVSSTAG